LDDKSVKCALLESSEESKAYRFYDSILKNIIINKDVVFVEFENQN